MNPLVAPRSLFPSSGSRMDSAIDALDIDPDDKRRIKITLQCPDGDSIPRVQDAGSVFQDRHGRYQLMHNGLKVAEHCYIGPWVTELIRLLRGLHEPQEEKAFEQVLQYVPQGATMVELGSWWSYYSMWFNKAIKGAKNFLIEPDPNNLEVGVHNFALNAMQGCHINAAVGRESIESVPYRCYESDNIERMIPVVCMDELIARESIGAVELLLADIQGAELDMLEGAANSIALGLIRFVVISTHHHSISNDPLTHQKCLRFLLERGAHILAEHSIDESYSGDGLIVAALRPADAGLPIIEVSRNSAKNSLFGELEYDLDRAWEEGRRLEAALRASELERKRVTAVLDATKAARRGVQVEGDARQLRNRQRAATLALRWQQASRIGLAPLLKTVLLRALQRLPQPAKIVLKRLAGRIIATALSHATSRPLARRLLHTHPNLPTRLAMESAVPETRTITQEDSKDLSTTARGIYTDMLEAIQLHETGH